MTFGNPAFLWLGVGVVLLAAVGQWSHARRRRLLAEFLGGRRAVTRLSGSDLYRLPLERVLLLSAAAMALAMSAAEPVWRTEADRAPMDSRSVVLALDISASMQATDAEPTRLGQAVQVALDLMETLEGDRVGLLLFAGASYELAPITGDHRPVRYFLGGVEPSVVSLVDRGTLMSAAIQNATELLGRPPDDAAEARSIILISDGDAGESDAAALALGAARAAKEQGIVVHTIGVGTSGGAGIVLPEEYLLGGRVLDASGAPLVSRLREQVLGDVAEAGGGTYAHADGVELGDLLGSGEGSAQQAGPEAPPFWSRYDLPLLLTLGALFCLLVESLLDVRIPAPRRAGVRRIA